MGDRAADPQRNAHLCLVCGDAELASGRLELPAERRPGVIRLRVPRVRTPTNMQLIYRAEQAGKQPAIARGIAPIEVYPDDLLAGLAHAWPGSSCWFGTCPTMLRTAPGCRRC